MHGLTVLYDEGCGFCTELALLLARRPGIAAEPIGSSVGTTLLRDLTPAQRYASLHVVDNAGRRRSGGAALPPLLRRLPGGSVPAAVCEALPGPTERAYRMIASHRDLAGRLSRPLLRRTRPI